MCRNHLTLFLFLNAIALLLSLLVTNITMAAPAVPSKMMDRGGLFFPGENIGEVEPAPLLRTDIKMSVSGPIVRYQMRHTFINSSDTWTEAIYTYPLPPDSAVNALEMTVGDRKIVGKIKEKAEAKRQFVAARQAGKRVSLVQQYRPNLFSTSLANIAPGEHVTVEIGFSETLLFKDHEFRLRMPLVIGPRYIPGQPIAGFQTTGWSKPTDQVPDANDITAPVRGVHEGTGNPVTISVDIDAGFNMDGIISPSHKINVVRDGEAKAIVSLEDTVPADKDFTLIWSAKTADAPSAGFFAEKIDDTRYALLTLTPQNLTELDVNVAPREVVFVIDTSGSMDGTSIEQAKRALGLALERLRPSDTFRLVRFSSDVSSMHPLALNASPENIKLGNRFVSSLLAEGGTEIVAAMSHVLLQRRDQQRLTQVVLVTDGAVGNEEALLKLINNQIGNARLFTVGIGSAPNGFLMTRAAAVGRGTFTFIEDANEVKRQMASLFEKLERPAMTDISLRWQGNTSSVSVWPNPVPDLYSGEPISVLAALPTETHAVEISGQINGRLWSTVVALKGAQSRPGIAALWARQKIKGLEAAMIRDRSPAEAKVRILATALKFGLVSRYTSLLAVDEKIVRPASEKLASKEIKTNFPDGWTRSEVKEPGAGDQGQALPLRTFDRRDPNLKSAMRGTASQLTGLPQTATVGPLALVIGLLIIAVGSLIRRRKRGLSCQV